LLERGDPLRSSTEGATKLGRLMRFSLRISQVEWTAGALIE
jgi:hypothetical protein